MFETLFWNRHSNTRRYRRSREAFKKKGKKITYGERGFKSDQILTWMPDLIAYLEMSGTTLERQV